MNIVLKNNKGISLLEIITSIVIISLIFLGFFTLFISSKKVNVASEEMIDATYIAQHTMEQLYSSTNVMNLEQIVDTYLDSLTNATTTYSTSNINNFTISFDHEFENTKVIIRAYKKVGSTIPSTLNLYNFIVEVYEYDVKKSTMENTFSIKM